MILESQGPDFDDKRMAGTRECISNRLLLLKFIAYQKILILYKIFRNGKTTSFNGNHWNTVTSKSCTCRQNIFGCRT